MNIVEYLLSLLKRKSPNPIPAPPNGPSMISSLLDLHNEYRLSYRINPLSLNEKLSLAAQQWAIRMATWKTVSHSIHDSYMADRIEAAGYKSWANLGENIAGDFRSPQEVMIAWEGSSDHRKNILSSSYQEVGFGLAFDIDGNFYWCTDFGTKQSNLFARPEGKVSLSGPLSRREG